MKKITIYQGDEYRAKIEKEFSEDDIFAEVYPQANRIVGEIIREMDKYEKESETSGRYSARYQGLGKNIVIFCGARGQGKTSAMQTFVRCLDGTYLKERKRQGLRLPSFMDDLQTNRFEVLDSIDPSAMENNESILRVVLSRLFFHLDECYQKNKFENSMQFERERADLTKLFQKCFDNIDYIKCKKSRDWEQDDLEILSQLGSSANLKNNLRNLIDKYLKLVSVESYADKKTGRYLVIPVDDADLATKKVFRLCEDIRNYLSIPNVIILMAADYDQLMSATYQKYLRQNRIRQQAAAGKYDKRLVEKDCYQMAAKYLEKLFPIGHRISLPKIGNLITENYENLKFEYLIQDGEMEKSAFEDEVRQCGNLQKQLIQLLYLRTGMILVNEDHALHSFLPHTFRELTHFVKMFYDMDRIDWELLNREEQRMQEHTEQYYVNVSNLKKNIQMVKQYYLNYWCAKHLNASEMNTVLKIDEASQKHQMKKVYKILRKHLDVKAEKENDGTTYRNVMQNIVEKKIGPHSWLREAMILYYTLFLNEWFAAAMEQQEQFEKIGEFVERVLDYPENMSEVRYRGKYAIHHFRMDVQCLAQNLGEEIGQEERTCLSYFCVAMQNGKIQNTASLFRTVDGKVRLDTENIGNDQKMMEMWFDVLHPLMMVLTHKNIRNQTELEEVTSVDANEAEGQQNAAVQYLPTVRNIIANYDVQMDLRESIREWYDKELKNPDRNMPSWRELCLKLYEKIDEKLRKYTNQDGTASKIFIDAGRKNGDLLNKIFLCNRENRVYYVHNLLDNFHRCHKATENLIGQYKNIDDRIRLQKSFQEYKRIVNNIFYDNPLDGNLDDDILNSSELELDRIIEKLMGPETEILAATGEWNDIKKLIEGLSMMFDEIEEIRKVVTEMGEEQS